MSQYISFCQLSLFEGCGACVIPGEVLLLSLEELVEGMKNMCIVWNEMMLIVN